MAEIVNLRTARKRAAREQKAVVAQENRTLHGEKLSDRKARLLEAERQERMVEGHRRDPGGASK